MSTNLGQTLKNCKGELWEEVFCKGSCKLGWRLRFGQDTCSRTAMTISNTVQSDHKLCLWRLSTMNCCTQCQADWSQWDLRLTRVSPETIGWLGMFLESPVTCQIFILKSKFSFPWWRSLLVQEQIKNLWRSPKLSKTKPSSSTLAQLRLQEKSSRSMTYFIPYSRISWKLNSTIPYAPKLEKKWHSVGESIRSSDWSDGLSSRKEKFCLWIRANCLKIDKLI